MCLSRKSTRFPAKISHCRPVSQWVAPLQPLELLSIQLVKVLVGVADDIPECFPPALPRIRVAGLEVRRQVTGAVSEIAHV
jgi:hypothetical protein